MVRIIAGISAVNLLIRFVLIGGAVNLNVLVADLLILTLVAEMSIMYVPVADLSFFWIFLEEKFHVQMVYALAADLMMWHFGHWLLDHERAGC